MEKPYADHQKIWESAGIANRISECRRITSEHGYENSLLGSDNFEKLTRVLYTLISDSIKGNFKKEIAISALDHVTNLHPDMASIILDVYNILDIETSDSDLRLSERENLTFFVKHTEKIVSDRLLKERLEIDTLQEMKVTENRNFHSKFIKVKTKLFYKQKKFNLFGEECEGYAKLITELNHRTTDVSTDYMMEVIKSLIGCFNLDPNRVLDVILDSFENHISEHDFYISLIKTYMPHSKTLSDMLGFKYVYYIDARKKTPRSLYVITAFLLQQNVILLEDIYGWLQPDDNLMLNEWEKTLNESRKRFKENSAIVVSFNKEKEDDDATMIENALYEKEYNQKFGLLEALLRIGEWRTFQKICTKLPVTYIVSQYFIAYNLCQLIHLLIDPIYRRYYEATHNLTNMSPKTISNPLAPKPVSTFVELKDVIFPMLYTMGSYLSYDPELVYKVIRLLKLALIQAGVTEQGPPPSEDSLYFEILTVLDLTILPTLSSLPHNCCVADEIWDVLKLYPYHFRYSLYARWKNETTYKYPDILKHTCNALKRIKEIMKKITKETTKSDGRHIGKLTHSSPGFVIKYILNQIMMYDNLIVPVVESLKFLTGLSYDFLSYCIIEMLMMPNRINSKQINGITANWLVNLSVFCGSIYKKYNIELAGILQYVCNQMKNHKSFDLLILKEIIQKMSGIEFSEDMTTDQLSALSGGEILRSEAGYFTHIRNTKRSSCRLKDALMENDLAVSLCLLIAQQRDCIVYRETTNVTLAGTIYDQCQDTLVQCGTFLNGVLSIDDYVIRLPSIELLLTEYHLRADVAFFLSRPKINFTIKAKYDELRKSYPNSKKWGEEEKYQEYYKAVVAITSPIVDSMCPLYPTKVWDYISPKFIILFWTLTLYDLEVPLDSYQREISKLRASNEELKNNKEVTALKTKKELDKNNILIEKLKEELKKQEEHTQKIMYRLETERDVWFNPRDVQMAKNETVTQFLQHCLFPRCIFTMMDAMFCAKFINVVHSLKTPNFSTLLCYDRLFSDIIYSITLCTAHEARRYGRFLCSALGTVMRWHSSKDIFDHECAKYPGFITKFRSGNQLSEANDQVDYENYRHVCHKWHFKITKAVVICLESKDHIRIRNALIVLIEIIPHFPILLKFAQIIEEKIEKIIADEKEETRGLSTLAKSYNGQLKNKSAQFIRGQDFHYGTASQSGKTASQNTKPTIAVANVDHSMNTLINVVGSKNVKEVKEEPTRDSGVKPVAEKSRIIDLVAEDVKNDIAETFELSKNMDYIGKEKSKEEKREHNEKKPKDGKIKVDKLVYEDRKDEFRQSSLREDIRNKPGPHRSESGNSWPDLPSPHEDEFQHKGLDTYDREVEPKRRKVTRSTSSGKPRSASNSPDSFNSSDKKVKQIKSKRTTRSSLVVIDLSESTKEKKRDSVGRKRVRAEQNDLLWEEIKKVDERPSKSHQNGDDLAKTLLLEKHHQSSSTHVKGHEKKTRDKPHPLKIRRSK